MTSQSAAITRAIGSAFGIRISEDDIRESRTLGDLSAHIRGRLADSSRDQHEKAIISYQLRLGLRESLGVASATVSAETRLDSLFPRSNRSKQWHALADAAQLNLPSLTHPRWLAIGALAICIAAMGVGMFFFWHGWSLGERLFAVIVAPFWPFMLWWMALYFSRGLARTFPGDCQTFGDLVQEAAQMNSMEPRGGSDHEKAGDVQENEDLVWKLLQALIAVETGRQIDEVQQQTRLSDIL